MWPTVFMLRTVLVLWGLALSVYVGVTRYVDIAMDYALTWPPVDGDAFDFVVVGAGSSGSVVASRLAQAGHSVLLLEAGGRSHWMQKVPALAALMQGSAYDFGYVTEPQKHAALTKKDQRVLYPRGRELGGSSVLNWMLYFRGHSTDYEEWARLGNTGWGWQDVLPLFKRSENYSGPNEAGWHGTDGPMHVMDTPHLYPINHVMLQAFKEMGYKVGDVNGDLEDGGFFERCQVTIKDGIRLGTYLSYVKPILNNKARANITVLSNAVVSKVHMQVEDAGNLKAVAVQAERFGTTYRYFARKEIIVSAGAVSTPQILMLSGIGPKKHLEEVGITPKIDLPVGENLKDHVQVPVNFFVSELTEETGLSSPFASLNPFNYWQLWRYGTGPLSDNSLGTSGMIRTGIDSFKEADYNKRPDIEVMMAVNSMGSDYGAGLKTAFANYEDSAFDSMFGPYLEKPTFAAYPTLNRPRSVGNIRLQSASISDPPLINPNYLSDKHDLGVLAAGAKQCDELSKTSAFSKRGIKSFTKDSKHCAGLDDDAYWKCYVKHWSTTVFHPVSTCKMGPDTDASAVVTPALKVRGVSGLRVADASVMPTLVGANTHAVCVMIGEKAADLILREWPAESAHDQKDHETVRKDEL